MPGHRWPTDLTSDLPAKTALTILNTEARGLTELTGRVLEGVVITTPDEDRLQHQLLIHAPVLGVRVPVLRATTGSAGTPIEVDGRYVRPPQEFASLDEFDAFVPRVLSAPGLVATVRRLIADSKEKGLPFFLVEDDEWVGDAADLEAAEERALRRVRQDDSIDIYELATGERTATVDWVGKDEPRVTRHGKFAAAAGGGASPTSPTAAPTQPTP